MASCCATMATAYSRAARQPHWDDHDEWGDAHRRSLDRLRQLFTGAPQAQHLLGDVRTIDEYERFIMHKLVTS